MSVSYVQGASNDAGTTSLALAFPSHPTAGNLLVVAGASDAGSGGTLTVSDSQGNAWTAVDAQQNESGLGGAAQLRVWWAVAKNSNTVTVTVNGTSTIDIGLSLAEFSSTTGWPASPVDGTIHGAGGATSGGSSVSTASFTPTAGDLVFAALCDSGSSETLSSTSPWLDGSSGTNHALASTLGHQNISAQYQASASGGSIHGAWTGATGATQCWAWAAFAPSSGGTVHTQTLAATLTGLAGGLGRQTNHLLAGALTGLAGSLTRQTAHALAAALTGLSGAAQRTFLFPRTQFAALLALYVHPGEGGFFLPGSGLWPGTDPAGFTKTTLHGLTASLSGLAGSLTRQTSKVIVAALTGLGGALLKLTSHALTASLSGLAGSLVRTFIFLRTVFTAALTGLAGALVRQTQKPLSATLTGLAASLTRMTLHGLAASLTGLAGGLGRVTLKPLSGALTGLAGTLTRQSAKVLSGGVALAGTLTRLTRKVLGATLTGLAGALNAVLSGGTVFTQTLAASLTGLGGALIKQTDKSLPAALTGLGATLTRQAAHLLVAGIALAGAAQRTFLFTRTQFAAALSGLGGSLSRQTGKALAASLNLAAALTRQTQQGLTAGLVLSAGLARRTSHALGAGLTGLGGVLSEVYQSGAAPIVALYRVAARALAYLTRPRAASYATPARPAAYRVVGAQPGVTMQEQPTTSTLFGDFIGAAEKISRPVDVSNWLASGETAVSATVQVYSYATATYPEGPPPKSQMTDVTLTFIPGASASPQALGAPTANVFPRSLGNGGQVPGTSYAIFTVYTTSAGRVLESLLVLACPDPS